MTATTPQFTPTATLKYRDIEPCGWQVDVVWSCDMPGLLDCTIGTGWILNDEKTAARLVTAINAGAVFGTAELHTDVNGRTFVYASRKVLGRTANADLKRLGF